MALNIPEKPATQDDVYKLTSILLENKEDALEQLLKEVCKILKADLGVICLLKDDKYIVQSVYSELPYAIDFDSVNNVTETFCFHAIKNGGVLAIPDVSNSSYSDLACCEVLKVNSYIGIPLKFDNKDIGTINFSARGERKDGYNKKELDLLVYLNEWVSHHLNRKYYKESLRNKNAELEAKNEKLSVLMEENSQLIQILVHDLKSPLSNIKMLSYLFQDFARDPDSEELIAIFNKSLDYVFHLIEQMETLNNMESLAIKNYIEEFDLNEFLAANVKDFKSTADTKSIKLNYEFRAENQIIKTDMNFLKRVIYNLISNALKFSPFERQIFVTVENADNHFLISVKDEGPGISEEDQKRLFHKFVKLSHRPTNSESSSGLGLFIVKELLKSIQGEVNVKSAVNEGSTFTVKLPFAI